MITYIPQYIIANTLGHCCFSERQPMDHLPLYEHLARKLCASKLPYEVLEDTSGIHSSGFPSFGSQHQLETTLAKVFLAVGTDCPRGRFLSRIGIRRWADLAKPIRVHGWESKAWFPWREGYDVCERKLREPGPNKYHPQAIYGQSCGYQLCGYKFRWRFVLTYGYSITYDKHSCKSSWDIEVYQTTESLRNFVNHTVPKWLDSVLEPEAEYDNSRQYSNRNHDQVTAAVERLFTDDWCNVGGSATTHDLVKLMHVNDIYVPSKLVLTRRRLTALRRWKRDDEAKEAKRQAALKEGGASC